MSHLISDLRPLGEGAFVGFSVREKEGGDCSTLQKYNHAAGFTCLQLFYSHLSAHLNKKKKSYVLSVLQSQVTVH